MLYDASALGYTRGRSGEETLKVYHPHPRRTQQSSLARSPTNIYNDSLAKAPPERQVMALTPACTSCSELRTQLETMQKEHESLQRLYAEEVKLHVTMTQHYSETNQKLLTEVNSLRRVIASSVVSPPKDKALAEAAKKVRTEEEEKKDDERKKKEKERATYEMFIDYCNRVDALEKDRETLKEDLAAMVESKM